MDAGADDDSPWGRDDWEPGVHPPVEFTPRISPADDAEDAPPAHVAPPSPAALTWRAPQDVPPDRSPESADQRRDGTRQRTLVAAGAVALAAVVVGVFALVGGGGGGDDAGATTTEATLGSSATSDLGVTTTVRRPAPTTAPARPAMSVSVRAVEAGQGGTAGVVSLITAQDRPNELELGRVAEWTTWAIPLVDPLDAVTERTEIVLVAAGMAHRIELPSGAVRTLDLGDVYDPGATFAVAGTTLALAFDDELVIIPDGEPAIAIDVGQVQTLRGRPGRGDFLVEVDRTGMSGWGYTDILVVDAEGDITSSIPGRPSSWWGTTWFGEVPVTATGDLLVSAPGGAYAIDPTGSVAPRRISDGAVAGGGRNHALLQSCDEQLTCHYVVHDLRTGETSPVVASLEPHSFSSMKVSPDGHRVAFVGPSDEQRFPVWQVVDLTTGEISFVGDRNTWLSADPWATDGHAFVLISDATIKVQTVSGRLAEIDGLGSPNNVIVQPAPTWAKRLDPDG